MAHDTDNLFAPPGAPLSGAPPEGEEGEARPAPAVHRLLACIVGLALAFGFSLASSIAGELIATTVGIAATLTAWEPMDYVAGAAFLLFYAPYALRRLARTGQTLPFRIFGLRFTKPGGTPAETWRILLLHGLPTALLAAGPFLAASVLGLGDPLDGVLRFAGLVALCGNALSAGRESGRTWLDGLAGMMVVRA